MSMPERTLGRSCRRMRIAVTTPKLPPPPRSAQNSSSSSVVFGDDDAPVRENDLCGEQIVERESEAADQRPIAAAQRKSGHADGADTSPSRPQGRADRSRDNVRGTSASGNSRGAMVGVDEHVLHAAEVDDDAIAQGATGPVVTSATHRQRKDRSRGRRELPTGRPRPSGSGRRRAACGRPALPR